MASRRQEVPRCRRQGRPGPAVSARRGGRRWSRTPPSPSSTRPWTSRCTSASIPGTPTRWCAARSCCRTAPARRCGCWSSPRATGSEEAEAAGADFVGIEYIQKIKDGWLECDVIVATPDVMGQLGPLGRMLGPRGLMPNPKAGTVTMDVTKAVREIKAGKIEFRVDKTGNVHAPIGKVSFSGGAAGRELAGVHGHHRCGPSPPRPRAPTSARRRSRAPWGRASGWRRRGTDEQDRTAGRRSKPDRPAQGLAQPLRHRLQRPQRAADDRVPPPAPRRGRRVRGREEHAGAAGPGRQRRDRRWTTTSRARPAWCWRATIRWPPPRCSATSPRSSRSRDQDRPGRRQAGHAGYVKRLGELPSARGAVAAGRSFRLPGPARRRLNGILYQVVGALEALREQRPVTNHRTERTTRCRPPR